MSVQPKTLSRSEARPRIVNEAIQQLQLDRHPFAWLTADYTLSDATSAQSAVNTSSNGAIGVAKDTAYEVDARYFINVTSSSIGAGHTWGVLFGGTATLSTLGTSLYAQSRTGVSSALQAVNGVAIGSTSLGTRTAVTVQSSSSAESVIISLSGRISVANAGTLIPQVQLSSTTKGTNTMQNGSYVRLHAIGHKSVTKDGPWS